MPDLLFHSDHSALYSLSPDGRGRRRAGRHFTSNPREEAECCWGAVAEVQYLILSVAIPSPGAQDQRGAPSPWKEVGSTHSQSGKSCSQPMVGAEGTCVWGELGWGRMEVPACRVAICWQTRGGVTGGKPVRTRGGRVQLNLW